MRDGRLVDTHVHVWDRTVLLYPWLDSEPELGRPALPAGIDRGAGADAMLHVQADCEPGQALAEIVWVRSLDWPELSGIIAFADLERRDGRESLASLADERLVVGVRQILRGMSASRLSRLAPAFADLHSAALTFDATVERGQLRELAALHARSDATTVVLDHLGDPPLAAEWSSPEAAQWRDGIRAVAACPSAVLKVSGLGAASREGERWQHTSRFVRHAFEAFGPERTVLGSDWPVTAPVSSPGIPWHRVLETELAGDPAAVEQVRSGTAIRTYGKEDIR